MEASKYLGRLVNIENGNLTIPVDILQTAQITGEQVEVMSTKEGVFIRSIDQECELCGTNSRLYLVGNKKLCSECTDGLGIDVSAK